MSGREGIKQPSVLDMARRNPNQMAVLIRDGGRPERRDVEAMAREGKDRMMPAELIKYLVDLAYNRKSGRPTKSKIQKGMDAWRRAEKMVAEIKALHRAGCSMTKAYEAYAKARGGKATPVSIERQYWNALKTVRERRAEADAMLQQAAQLMGVSVEDIISNMLASR